MCRYCENEEYTIRISVDKWNKDKKIWEPENNFEAEYCLMCRKEAGRVTIREYVFRNNISYKQLAKQLNISQAYLCDLSKGRRETISENLANRFKEVAPEIDITTEIRKYYKIK